MSISSSSSSPSSTHIFSGRYLPPHPPPLIAKPAPPPNPFNPRPDQRPAQEGGGGDQEDENDDLVFHAVALETGREDVGVRGACADW